MTPKEIVRRTIRFEDAPRIPFLYVNRDFHRSDILMTGAAADPAFDDEGGLRCEWGFRWRHLDDTMGQPDQRPLTHWENLDRFTPPKADVPARVAHIPAFAAAHADRYLIGGLGITGFNLVTFLRGFENTLADLYTDRVRIEELIDMVMDYECGLIRLFGELGCLDGVYFGDDWGMQDRLMIHPDLWREVFKPRYARQFALAHAYGLDVFFHSCGYVYDIIADWVQIGVDVFNFNEPDLLGIERLGREFGGKVCFCCSLNHQRTALFGSAQEIEAVARRLKEHLWVQGGGFIANIEDYRSLGMSEANYRAIVQAFEALNR